MKVSYSWLKDYVDVNLDPEKLAHLLTMAGVNVASFEKIRGDYIFEFEITANRPDCLSILGIARETAAILGKTLKVPKELHADSKPKQKIKDKTAPDIILEGTELCFRYTARVIRDVEVGPSPDWLKDRIISVGIRPVNNIVDITNFVLFETGQPMHAFDLDKINGDVYVRRARKGESLITLDSSQRECDQETLVIADESGPVAIAGIMGGLETEVNNMTKNILLESAFFNPISVRRTSRRMGLSSESSYRFERRIDNNMVVKASERAAALIEKLSGDNMGPIVDVGNKTAYSKNINFDLKKADAILGVSIGKNKAAKILKSLGFSVEEKKDAIKVTVPSFREDVKTDIDVTEEVARIYGYENIPITVPQMVGNTRIKDFETIFREKISERLTRLGLNEIITYSLIPRDSIKDLGINMKEAVTVKNPLSIDQEIMRPTLLPGMLGVISYNFNRSAKRLSLFEVGKVYREKDASYFEEPVLSVAVCGTKQEDWNVRKDEFKFFDIKGIFERLLGEIGIEGIVFRKDRITIFDANAVSLIEYKGEVIGCLGEVDEKIRNKFDIEKKVFYGELYIEKIVDKVSLDKKYVPLGRYPSVMRDISAVLDKDVPSAEVISIIRDTGKALVKDVSLVDTYKGKQIPAGKRGLLYRVEYRSDEKTLEDAEVDKVHSEIKDDLTQKLNISFR